MRDINTLIIPDVHGRTFWREPVMETLTQTGKIVFIGDYHDPYPHEWKEGDYLQGSVDRFKEIIDLKKQNPERITLLIGNHDCGYAVHPDVCSSRRDRRHARELETLFQDNKSLFRLADAVDIAGKHFVFSHAGILKGWADAVWGEEVNDPGFDVVKELNKAWDEDIYGVLMALGHYDCYRGWGGFKYGSPVWSDINSWISITPEETFGFNIVGHTQLKQNPIVLDTIADLDCRKAFYLDNDGVLRFYESGEEVKKTEMNPSEI